MILIVTVTQTAQAARASLDKILPLTPKSDHGEAVGSILITKQNFIVVLIK